MHPQYARLGWGRHSKMGGAVGRKGGSRDMNRIFFFFFERKRLRGGNDRAG